jgi:hypothetical protein
LLKLLTNTSLTSLLKNNDLKMFKSLIENKKLEHEDVCSSKDVYTSRFLTDEFKNGLIVSFIVKLSQMKLFFALEVKLRICITKKG